MKQVWLFSFCFLLSTQSLFANNAQEIVAHFFNIITAGLLMATAKENREQKIAAATALIAGVSAMTQKILEEDAPEEISNDVKRNNMQMHTMNFIEEIYHLLLDRMSNDKELKTLIENYILIYELHKQIELQNEHEQTD